MSTLLVVLGDGETYDAIENVSIVEVDDEVFDDDFNGKKLKDATLYGRTVNGIRRLGGIAEIDPQEG